MKCLLLASQDTPLLPSEAQELLNSWSAVGWEVTLLHYKVTYLELYRNANKTYDLLWVMGHSTSEGFLFGNEVITSAELGLFALRVQAKELILNSCTNLQHAQTIQRIYPEVGILVATINVADEAAWKFSLFFGKSIITHGCAELAFQREIANTTLDYIWLTRKIPMLHVVDSEIIIAKLVRALSGDEFTHQPGLIDAMRSLELKMHEYIENDQAWKKTTQTRIQQIEMNTIVVISKLQGIIFIGLVVAIGILLTYVILV
jgi:hypothetical protein